MILKSWFFLYSDERILTLGPEVTLAVAKIRLKMLEAFFKNPIQMPHKRAVITGIGGRHPNRSCLLCEPPRENRELW